MALAKVESRHDFDLKLGDNAWQVPDSTATYHSSQNLQQFDVTIDTESPLTSRRIKSRRSTMNFKKIPEEPEEGDIIVNL